MSARIMIVDDHEIVRIGLKTLFEANKDFEVVSEAKTAREAVEIAKCQKPDVVLMDIRLPDYSGIDACRQIRDERPEAKVIMLTSYGDQDAVIESIMAGASGYVLKRIFGDDLVNSVKEVLKGKSLLDSTVAASVMDYIKNLEHEETEGIEQLTPQEKKVLALIAEAKTNRQIAALLFISEKTVRNYVSSILKKLSLDNRSEAVIYGRHKKRFL